MNCAGPARHVHAAIVVITAVVLAGYGVVKGSITIFHGIRNITADGQCALISVGNGTRVAELTSMMHRFRHGSVAVLRSGWVVAGMEIDAAGGKAGAEEDEVGNARLFAQAEGEIALPAGLAGSHVRAPVPVVLGEERWGLMWATVEPPEGFRGVRWPDFAYTELWFSERFAGGWREPKLIFQSGRFFDWTRGRNVQYVPGRGTFLMFVENRGFNGNRIIFGNVEGQIQEVSLSEAVSVQSAAFQVNEAGIVNLVAIIEKREGNHTLRELVMMHADNGEWWSSPEVIWELDSSGPSVGSLQFRIDMAGNQHVLWDEGWDGSTRHIWRPKDRNEWRMMPIEDPDGDLIAWWSGVNRCGQVSLVRAAIRSPWSLSIQTATWNSSWSPFEDVLPGIGATYLFDGAGYDGRWYLGWSGNLANSPAGASQSSSVWISPY